MDPQMSTIATALRVNPYMHVDPERIYNPLTDETLLAGTREYELFRAFERGEGSGEELLHGGWVVPEDVDVSRAYRLKIVSLETLTTCNQRCYFCPVSIAPREDQVMPTPLFDSIVEQLTTFPALEAVFLQNYNEPTIDPRFVELCERLNSAGLPVAVLTNGSGLTPAKVDRLVAMGGLKFLCVNLSTTDPQQYKDDRGVDHTKVVLRNVEYMRDLPVAELMRIIVLGKGDAAHQENFEEVQRRFAGSRFEIQKHQVQDRAGWLDVGIKALQKIDHLAGCDLVGSRPLQHLHITPAGKCVLCCQDYDEKYIVGDLTEASITEVLEGDEMAKMRRWTYGVEEAPDDFICRTCVWARAR
jgi:pyruvate-formate lyase-activating enzyme